MVGVTVRSTSPWASRVRRVWVSIFVADAADAVGELPVPDGAAGQGDEGEGDPFAGDGGEDLPGRAGGAERVVGDVAGRCPRRPTSTRTWPWPPPPGPSPTGSPTADHRRTPS